MIDEYVFRSKYSRYNKNLKRRESWDEAVDRMMDMHQSKFPELSEEIKICSEGMKSRKITGSQRALQFGGEAVEKKNMRLYNCVSSYADRPRFFSESLWLLLCGCGVGFSVQRHHVDRLPSIQEPGYPHTHIVEDSIEGWADAVQALFDAYMEGSDHPWFDFAQVRPKGSPIKFGGAAPGPEPLKKALDAVEEILKGRIGERLTTLDVFDCVMHLADSVLTAGIRRAATIATFDIDDELMLHAKTGEWVTDNPQRGRANISAIATPETTEDQFAKIFTSTKQFGEPGVIFLDSKELSVNPCVEIVMCPMLISKDGDVVENYTLDLINYANRAEWETRGYIFESGWQACNLSTINASKVGSESDFYEAAQLAATVGTMQSAYTQSGYLGAVSQKIIERESLLGVSICGVMDAPEVCLKPEILRRGAQIVLDTNERMAAKLGIAKASRTTCVKPEGTTSIVLNASSGIHPHHARKYIRRVQANMDDPIFQSFYAQNPHAVEDSVWGADKVISFAMEAPESALVKSDLSAKEFMEASKIVYENWVVPGTRVGRLEGATHNVSITVTVNPEEWSSVQSYLWANRESFCGVSFLGSSGDYDYPQAPLQYVDRDSADPKVREAFSFWQTLKDSANPVVYDSIFEETDVTSGIHEPACAGGQCMLV